MKPSDFEARVATALAEHDGTLHCHLAGPNIVDHVGYQAALYSFQGGKSRTGGYLLFIADTRPTTSKFDQKVLTDDTASIQTGERGFRIGGSSKISTTFQGLGRAMTIAYPTSE